MWSHSKYENFLFCIFTYFGINTEYYQQLFVFHEFYQEALQAILLNLYNQQTFTCSNSLEKSVKYVQSRLRSGVFIVNFEKCFSPFFSASIVVFEQVNVC